MPRPWNERWDFYEATLDGSRLVIAIDMGAIDSAPLPSHGLRCQVRVAMKQPRRDGLRSSEEADALFALEDRLVALFSRTADGFHVGRFVADGHCTFVFHAPNDAGALLGEAVRTVNQQTDYDLEWLTGPDPAWTYLHDFLAPNAYERQTMLNRTLIRARAERGDRAEQPRDVDHYAYFSSARSADMAATSLREAGFRTDPPTVRDDGRIGLGFHRTDAVDQRHADAFIAQIFTLLAQSNGSYDGWGALIVT